MSTSEDESTTALNSTAFSKTDSEWTPRRRMHGDICETTLRFYPAFSGLCLSRRHRVDRFNKSTEMETYNHPVDAKSRVKNFFQNLRGLFWRVNPAIDEGSSSDISCSSSDCRSPNSDN